MKRILILTIIVMIVCAVCACGENVDNYFVPAPGEVVGEVKTVRTAVDLTGLVSSVIALVGELLMAVIAAAVIPPVRKWMQARMTKTQQDMTIEMVRQLVLAAEQMFGAGFGSDKLDSVVSGMKERGIEVDMDLIEAAVKEMNDRNRVKIIDELKFVDDGK